jgi:hypothetical protein
MFPNETILEQRIPAKELEMTANNLRHLDQSGAYDARSVTALTLDDLIDQIRSIMRADDPLTDGLPVLAATAGEEH